MTKVAENGLAIITPEEKLKTVFEEKGITKALIEELKVNSGLKVNAKIEGDKVIWNNDILEIIKANRKKAKAARVLIEKVCKADRDAANQYIKDNRLFELGWTVQFEQLEAPWQQEEDSVDFLKEQIRVEEERKQEMLFRSRIKELEALGMQPRDFMQYYELNELKVQSVDLKFMPEGGYQSFFNQVKEEAAKIKAEEDRIAAEKKAEEDRIAKVKAEQEAEAKRLEAIAKEQERKEKLIAESQAKIEAEKKRIEDEKQAAEQAKIREQELIKAREEAAEKAKKEAEEKAERDRIAAEAKAKADELAKIEADRKAAELAAKRELRKPDKKKLIEFADAITAIVSPELKSEEATGILEAAVKQLSAISQAIKTQIEKL